MLNHEELIKTAHALNEYRQHNPFLHRAEDFTIKAAVEMLTESAHQVSGSCWRCHQTISPDYRFCPYCRARQHEDQTDD